MKELADRCWRNWCRRAGRGKQDCGKPATIPLPPESAGPRPTRLSGGRIGDEAWLFGLPVGKQMTAFLKIEEPSRELEELMTGTRAQQWAKRLAVEETLAPPRRKVVATQPPAERPAAKRRVVEAIPSSPGEYLPPPPPRPVAVPVCTAGPSSVFAPPEEVLPASPDEAELRRKAEEAAEALRRLERRKAQKRLEETQF